jgi:uncharacterized membrane protein YebE (DUF533 family)
MTRGAWCGKIAKSVVILGSGVALAACAYAAYRYWKRRDPKNIDEGFEDVSKVGYLKVLPAAFILTCTCHKHCITNKLLLLLLAG